MTSGEFNIYHRPVMLEQVLDLLAVKSEGVYVDCTAGGGGHSAGIFEKLASGGLLICIDKDSRALEETQKRLKSIKSKAEFRLVKSDFSNIKDVLKKEDIDCVDGILADFGVSSHQLDENHRGFGYMRSGPLDMRMDTDASLTAAKVVNDYPREELERIIHEYGEERYSSRIAGAICKVRERRQITDTEDLAGIIASCLPSKARREHQHPAKRTFQAIRIEVNQELGSIAGLLSDFPDLLADQGRFAAISFHSLEDRMVKDAFRKLENPCVCPKDFPVCNCGKIPLGRSLTGKPVTADDEETEFNPRARSAKLRVFIKGS
ncbi:MAG: 16S rRNA (cytosine(1402)-N(4))-methyltransferase RsmH [Eubacteriales bacterium]|jgi:16S rRNA (cytosine1402-N4)-methyltransferase|nr:16S rRNA (cytosine(1402)-N(4))-methyltransferase RsmH [Eubacteriales bacterium]MDD4326604.1 16S rRNA (cytosine(1402)-N(4))-methyltransferase RsmH [Eubacteriales bacterium]MDD4716534.1 16S rRNA (cytosine(1402)-N(4))-methyltransferase RsmH [Eubacteriales bacterium]